MWKLTDASQQYRGIWFLLVNDAEAETTFLNAVVELNILDPYERTAGKS